MLSIDISKCMSKCCCRRQAGKKNVVYLFTWHSVATKWNQNTRPYERAFALVQAPRACPPLPPQRCYDLSQVLGATPLRQADVMLNLKHVATEIRIKTRRVLRLWLRHVRLGCATTLSLSLSHSLLPTCRCDGDTYRQRLTSGVAYHTRARFN